MKKIAQYIWKILLLLFIAGILGYALAVFYFAIGFHGLSSPPTDLENFIMTAVTLLVAAAYLYFAAWLSRIGVSTTLDFKQKIKMFLKLIIPTACIITLYCVMPSLEYEFENQLAQYYYNQADEIICYQNTSDTYDHLMTTPLNKSSALLNYDKMNVTFIFYMGFDQCKHYKLEKTNVNPFENLPIQFQTSLNSPAKTFTTYYDPNSSSSDSNHSKRFTRGVLIEMQDGTLWKADIDNELLDIEYGLYPEVSEAKNCADESIIFGKNRLPNYANGINSNTIMLDYDAMTAYIIYEDENTVYCNKLKFEQINSMPEVNIQAKFTLHSPGTYLYAFHKVRSIYEDWDKDKTDGFILETEDNKYWIADDWGYYDFYHSINTIS